MKLLEEIRRSNKKPKELLVYLTGLVQKDPSLLTGYEGCLKAGTPVERGICMETLEHIAADSPELAVAHIDIVTAYLNDPAPRVKWEAARVIANIARKFPEKVSRAIDKLLINTKDKGTVVRWSAAFALGEITKYNFKLRDALTLKINTILKTETNNGVKNVYLKALQVIKQEGGSN